MSQDFTRSLNSCMYDIDYFQDTCMFAYAHTKITYSTWAESWWNATYQILVNFVKEWSEWYSRIFN